jgi:hypothetical protein
MHENDSSGKTPPGAGHRPRTYRCTGCDHRFMEHGDAGCRHASGEPPERCTCTQPIRALFGSYGPFPPLTVRGRYARHLRRYRVRNDPWQVAMRPIFAALRARRQNGPPFIPPWPPLI